MRAVRAPEARSSDHGLEGVRERAHALRGERAFRLDEIADQPRCRIDARGLQHGGEISLLIGVRAGVASGARATEGIADRVLGDAEVRRERSAPPPPVAVDQGVVEIDEEGTVHGAREASPSERVTPWDRTGRPGADRRSRCRSRRGYRGRPRSPAPPRRAGNERRRPAGTARRARARARRPSRSDGGSSAGGR